jgi:hypothetical protein
MKLMDCEGQSKNCGQKLELTQLENHQLELLDNNPWSGELEELLVSIVDAKAHVHRLSEMAQKQEQALGIAQKQSLQQILKSAYIRLRMNAQALKQRIRDCLH